MVLYKKGYRAYFNDNLLFFLWSKRNNDVQKILEDYKPNDASSKITLLKDSAKATLLHYSSAYGNEQMVKQLINLGSDINAQNFFGSTPLMLAVIEGHATVVETLLEANANVNITHCQGKNPLQTLLELEPIHLNRIKNLFKEMSLQNMIKLGVIKHFRARLSLSQVVLIKNIELMKLLLDHGYEIDGRDSESGYKTALHTAVLCRDLEMVKLLVNYGANVDALDNKNTTPLFYSYDVEIVKVLLNRAKLLTESNENGEMQIKRVLTSGCRVAVKLVLEKIDNLNIIDVKGNSVIHYLAENYHSDAIEILKDQNFNVDARNHDGDTPLLLALRNYSPNAVKFLLDNGANTYIQGCLVDNPLYGLFKNWIGESLSWAKQCIEVLVEYGFKFYDEEGNTVFDIVLKEERILTLVEPVIAVIAADKTLEIEILLHVRIKMSMQPTWIEYFDTCEKEIEKMTKIKIYGTITLFEFLTANQKKICGYVRNEDIVSEIKRAIDEFQKDSPYSNLLRIRLSRAIRLAELKEIAIVALCRLINPTYKVDYPVVEYIVDYLNIKDMRNLIFIF